MWRKDENIRNVRRERMNVAIDWLLTLIVTAVVVAVLFGAAKTTFGADSAADSTSVGDAESVRKLKLALDLARARANLVGITQPASKSHPSYPPTANPATLSNRQQVKRLHASWCGPCRDWSDRLTAAVRSALPFELIDIDVDREGYFGVTSIPAAVWYANGRRYSYQGSNTDELVRIWKQSQLPQTVSRPLQSNYYNPSWTWPGNLHNHLQSTHGVGNAASLSQDDAERLHDSLHNSAGGHRSRKRRR